jgi:hypothetical protein
LLRFSLLLFQEQEVVDVASDGSSEEDAEEDYKVSVVKKKNYKSEYSKLKDIIAFFYSFVVLCQEFKRGINHYSKGAKVARTEVPG